MNIHRPGSVGMAQTSWVWNDSTEKAGVYTEGLELGLGI